MEKTQHYIPESDQIEYEDMESGVSSKTTSIKEIILRQYQRCLTEGSKEMSLGGVKKRIVNGQVYEIAVPNQIEVFINSVEMLKILLGAHIAKEKDKEIVNKMNNHDKKSNEIRQSYDKAIDNIMVEYKPYNEKWVQKNREEHNRKLTNVERSYENLRVSIYREILITIGFLLNRLNYFDEVITYG